MSLPASVYVLVHPETYPSNWMGNFPELTDPLPAGTDLDLLYAAQINAHAARHDRRVVVLDQLAADDLDDDWPFQHGVDPDGWEIVIGEVNELEQLTVENVGEGTRVTLAGFHRQDCVARVRDRLRDLGATVILHEEAVLPLTDTAFARLLAVK